MDLLHEKKHKNIAAYVISMWHLEDLMRANKFDMQHISELLIDPLDADDATKHRIRAQYQGIADKMKEQGITKQGHLIEVSEVMMELHFLHQSLMNVMRDEEYIKKFNAAGSGINAVIQQSQGKVKGPIEACFNGVYGVLVLKAKGQAIHAATLQDEALIRDLLGTLSERYKQWRPLPGVSLN